MNLYSQIKPHRIVIEVLDEKGRYIREKEFNIIINQFRDRYDPVRLSFALAYTTGLRYFDAYSARIPWFNSDFTEMKMAQCKAHVSFKDGIIRQRKQPRFVPLPDWLATDLKYYLTHRILVAKYVGQELTNLRLFPTLKKNNMRSFFQHLRDRKSEDFPWLKDIWQIVKAYDINNSIVWERAYYRVSCHACRANYTTKAHKVAEGDYIRGSKISGHEEIKNYAKYVRYENLDQDKVRIKEEYMDSLSSSQMIPLLVGQRNLKKYI